MVEAGARPRRKQKAQPVTMASFKHMGDAVPRQRWTEGFAAVATAIISVVTT